MARLHIRIAWGENAAYLVLWDRNLSKAQPGDSSASCDVNWDDLVSFSW